MSDNTCKYMTIGALAIAIGVILLSGDRVKCTDCEKQEENVSKKVVTISSKPVKKTVDKNQNPKGDNVQSDQILGYEGGDYASF